MRYILLIIFLIPTIIYSQNGSVRGLVKDAKEVLPFVNVGLVGTSFGAATDINGKFEIKDVPAGKYTIQISSVGFKNHKSSIIVLAGKTSYDNVIMEKTSSQLDEFVVT